MFDLGPIKESHRLRSESQRVRADALRTRLMAVDTFCSIAERQAKWESAAAARETLSKAWHTIEEIDRHIEEPHHVTTRAAAMLRDMLRKVTERSSKIEAELDIR